MYFPPVRYETYATLRDRELSHPDVKGTQWRLGHTSSWARWGERGDLIGPIAAENSTEFADLKPMTTAVLLLGINWGGEDPPINPSYWQNFHTPGHRGDGALRNSVRAAYAEVLDEDAPVAYMSDVFKLVPTPNASKLSPTLKREARAGRDHVARCADLLKWELTQCAEGAGVTPTIVAMGKTAYEWLSGTGKDHRIAMVVEAVLGPNGPTRVRQMPHYTFGSATGAQRQDALMRILREAIGDAS